MSLYSDDGPPAHAQRLEADGYLSGDEVVGWTVLDASDDGMLAYSITTATGSRVERRGLIADQVLLPQWVIQQEQGDAHEADALLIATAQEIEADLLVTERAVLLDSELEDRGNCRIATPETSIALVALFLRSRGEYIMAKSTNFTGMANPRHYYDKVAARCLSSLETFESRAVGTVSAARLLTIRRRARAMLEARDRLALLTSEPITDDVAENIEATFVHALVDMVAFHDLLARVINERLPEPEREPRRTKWQIDNWRRAVVRAFPNLSEAWSDDGFGTAVNRALRQLRNEIHDVAPIVTPFRTRWGAPQIGLAFHSRVGTAVTEALRTLPDTGERGIEKRFSDGHVIQPHTFFEFVLPWLFQSVDATLASLLPLLPEREFAPSDSILNSNAVGQSLDAITLLRRPKAHL